MFVWISEKKFMDSVCARSLNGAVLIKFDKFVLIVFLAAQSAGRGSKRVWTQVTLIPTSNSRL